MEQGPGTLVHKLSLSGLSHFHWESGGRPPVCRHRDHQINKLFFTDPNKKWIEPFLHALLVKELSSYPSDPNKLRKKQSTNTLTCTFASRKSKCDYPCKHANELPVFTLKSKTEFINNSIIKAFYTSWCLMLWINLSPNWKMCLRSEKSIFYIYLSFLPPCRSKWSHWKPHGLVILYPIFQ